MFLQIAVVVVVVIVIILKPYLIENICNFIALNNYNIKVIKKYKKKMEWNEIEFLPDSSLSWKEGHNLIIGGRGTGWFIFT